MLKWARCIFVFLLLGAIVNVAVAWGCVLRAGDPDQWPFELTMEGEPWTAVTVTGKFGLQCTRVDGNPNDPAFIRVGNNRHWTTYPGNLWSEAWLANGAAIRTRAGWPMLVVEGWELNRVWIPQSAPTASTLQGGNIQWAWIWGGSKPQSFQSWLMPMRPIPIGFVANSVLYGFCVFMVAYAIVTTHRRTRTRRGRCAYCGYPRGTSRVCTECGEVLPC